LIASYGASSWRWRIVSTLCGAVLALALTEGILRITGTGWLAARVAPDDSRFIAQSPGTDDWPVIRQAGDPIAFVPGSVLEVRHPEYRFVFHIDRWGGRVASAAQTSPPEVVFLEIPRRLASASTTLKPFPRCSRAGSIGGLSIWECRAARCRTR
jgi:hypothetical protein